MRSASSGLASAPVPLVPTPEMLSDPCRGLVSLALALCSSWDFHLGLCVSQGSPEKRNEKDVSERIFIIIGLGISPDLTSEDQEP